MTEKRSKYDTDPLDPDFVRRTEENLWGAARAPRPEVADQSRRDSVTEEPTRRLDEQMADSYPSVFVPPAYQPPRPQPQPFANFGTESHQPPATTAAPPPGPSSPYPNQYQAYTGPTHRPIARLGIQEKWAVILPYVPFFFVGLAAGLIELLVVPRTETRTRFHAAQGLALQLAFLAGTLFFKFVALVTGSGAGGALFWLVSTVFLVISVLRIWQGKPHHIAQLDEPVRWLDGGITPMK
jgi:hypothetical protein